METTAVKHQHLTFVLGQLIRHLGKLAVGNADGAGDMAFVVFFALGPGINQNHPGIFVELFFDPLHRNSRVVAGNFLIGRESVGKYFDIGVTEFFRLPGGFVTQLSCGAAAVKYEQGIFILGQLLGHFVELAVRNADRPGNVARRELAGYRFSWWSNAPRCRGTYENG